MSRPFTMKRASEEVPDEDAIRVRRVEIARRNPRWNEVEETALVRRERWFVHADTDEMFSLYRGPVFMTGSASVAFNDRVDMFFYVRGDGEVIFLERQPGTWSEIVARRARRALR
jgi:hypothetical protein